MNTHEQKNAYILKELRDESLISPKGSQLRYQIDLIFDVGGAISPPMPNNKERELIIRKLQIDGAVIIDNEERYDDRIVFELSLKQPQFEQLCREYKIIKSDLPYISYDENSGIGKADEKRFQLMDKERKIFSEMYANINHPIENVRIRELLGMEADRKIPFDTTGLVREMRRKTGLGTKHLVQKKGVLTLRGVKISESVSV